MTPMRRRTSPGRRDVQAGQARAPRRRLPKSSVQRILMVVVLPAPFGPGEPEDLPGADGKPMPRTASTSRFLASCLTSMTAVGRRSHPAQANGGAASWGGRSARRPGFEDRAVPGRQRAGRIGRGGVAGERERLAAAAAEVDAALVAGPAGRRHPVLAAERAQRRRIAPDVGKRTLSHAFE
jgi:hypothetical protein